MHPRCQLCQYGNWGHSSSPPCFCTCQNEELACKLSAQRAARRSALTGRCGSPRRAERLSRASGREPPPSSAGKVRPRLGQTQEPGRAGPLAHASGAVAGGGSRPPAACGTCRTTSLPPRAARSGGGGGGPMALAELYTQVSGAGSGPRGYRAAMAGAAPEGKRRRLVPRPLRGRRAAREGKGKGWPGRESNAGLAGVCLGVLCLLGLRRRCGKTLRRLPY